MSMRQLLSQLRPPTPGFTEKECPDQTGKVFIVTGGYSGIGFELTKILYKKNGKVYIAGRSYSKGEDAIKNIRAESPASNGNLVFLPIELNDLTTIKPAAEQFLQQEQRLDVLWNNAGVMVPPKGSMTKEGYEMQLGVNCIAPFLLTRLLLPILTRTAASAPKDSVRICFAGSLAAERQAPPGVINFDDINLEKGGSQQVKYGQSKAGNILLASEFARRYRDSGVLSLSFNPGNLKTDLRRHSSITKQAADSVFLYHAKYGAYTELYAGLSPDITAELNGCYIIPWGRVGKLKSILQDAVKAKSDGGTDAAGRFYEWCDAQVVQYL